MERPRRLTGQQVLDILFALPSDPDDSDAEADSGAEEELNELAFITDWTNVESPDDFTRQRRSVRISGSSKQTAEQMSGDTTETETTAEQPGDVTETGQTSSQSASSSKQAAGQLPDDVNETETARKSTQSARSSKTTAEQPGDVTVSSRQTHLRVEDIYSSCDTEFSSDDTAEYVVCSTWGHETKCFDFLPSFDYEAPCDMTMLGCNAKELDFFKQVFTDDIVQNIVEQTNLYAEQMKAKSVRKASSKTRVTDVTKHWVPITAREFEAFLGMCILMGIHKLPELKHYWVSDPILGVPAVSRVMGSKRFKKITEALHLNDNETNLPHNDPGYDKLHKVRPLIDMLNKVIGDVYDSSNAVSVDESMIPFKGRTTLKQYMPMKPIKRGYKVWCLADSHTGYVLKFEIYTGKANNDHNRPSDVGLGHHVVLNLTSCMEKTCRLVAFDNFFTSVQLMIDLLNKGLYSVGTVRPNRRGLPAMMNAKTKLSRGEHVFETKGPIAAIKWQDRKPVTLLTTACNPSDVRNISRKNKDGTKSEVSCPLAIVRYNEIMGGVDRFDQYRERYAIGRRSIKWWHRIFFYLADLAIVDAFILWAVSRRTDVKYDQLTFRLRLARQLIGDFTSRKQRGRPVAFLSHKATVPDDVRLVGVGQHFPVVQKTFRRCRMCSTRKREKRSRYLCSACNVPLCLDNCFRQFHGK